MILLQLSYNGDRYDTVLVALAIPYNGDRYDTVLAAFIDGDRYERLQYNGQDDGGINKRMRIIGNDDDGEGGIGLFVVVVVAVAVGRMRINDDGFRWIKMRRCNQGVSY